MVTTDSIRQLVEPALTSAGLELWDVEVARDVLRIMVDRPGGVDMEALSLASGVLSPLLDEHPEATPEGRYQLEVSSPGVERTLRTPGQYQQYIGTEISVKTAEPIEGARRHRGRLLSAGSDRISIEADAPAGTPLELRYDQIDRARTVLVWGPAPRPSGKPGARKAAATSPTQPKDAG